MSGLNRTLVLFAAAMFMTACDKEPDAYAQCKITKSLWPIDHTGLKCGVGLNTLKSYPAKEFLASLSDDKEGHITEYKGHHITSIQCPRFSLIPTEADYAVIATGIRMRLHQAQNGQFVALTIFWKDGVFDYIYNGSPLSPTEQTALDERLADFTQRGLNPKARGKLGLTPRLNQTQKDPTRKTGMKIAQNDLNCTY